MMNAVQKTTTTTTMILMQRDSSWMKNRHLRSGAFTRYWSAIRQSWRAPVPGYFHVKLAKIWTFAKICRGARTLTHGHSPHGSMPSWSRKRTSSFSSSTASAPSSQQLARVVIKIGRQYIQKCGFWNDPTINHTSYIKIVTASIAHLCQNSRSESRMCILQFIFSREPRLYKRVCPSVGWSVGRSVGLSVRRSGRRLVMLLLGGQRRAGERLISCIQTSH